MVRAIPIFLFFRFHHHSSIAFRPFIRLAMKLWDALRGRSPAKNPVVTKNGDEKPILPFNHNVTILEEDNANQNKNSSKQSNYDTQPSSSRASDHPRLPLEGRLPDDHFVVINQMCKASETSSSSIKDSTQLQYVFSENKNMDLLSHSEQVISSSHRSRVALSESEQDANSATTDSNDDDSSTVSKTIRRSIRASPKRSTMYPRRLCRRSRAVNVTRTSYNCNNEDMKEETTLEKKISIDPSISHTETNDASLDEESPQEEHNKEYEHINEIFPISVSKTPSSAANSYSVASEAKEAHSQLDTLKSSRHRNRPYVAMSRRPHYLRPSNSVSQQYATDSEAEVDESLVPVRSEVTKIRTQIIISPTISPRPTLKPIHAYQEEQSWPRKALDYTPPDESENNHQLVNDGGIYDNRTDDKSIPLKSAYGPTVSSEERTKQTKTSRYRQSDTQTVRVSLRVSQASRNRKLLSQSDNRSKVVDEASSGRRKTLRNPHTNLKFRNNPIKLNTDVEALTGRSASTPHSGKHTSRNIVHLPPVDSIATTDKGHPSASLSPRPTHLLSKESTNIALCTSDGENKDMEASDAAVVTKHTRSRCTYTLSPLRTGLDGRSEEKRSSSISRRHKSPVRFALPSDTQHELFTAVVIGALPALQSPSHAAEPKSRKCIDANELKECADSKDTNNTIDNDFHMEHKLAPLSSRISPKTPHSPHSTHSPHSPHSPRAFPPIRLSTVARVKKTLTVIESSVATSAKLVEDNSSALLGRRKRSQHKIRLEYNDDCHSASTHSPRPCRLDQIANTSVKHIDLLTDQGNEAIESYFVSSDYEDALVERPHTPPHGARGSRRGREGSKIPHTSAEIASEPELSGFVGPNNDNSDELATRSVEISTEVGVSVSVAIGDNITTCSSPTSTSNKTTKEPVAQSNNMIAETQVEIETETKSTNIVTDNRIDMNSLWTSSLEAKWSEVEFLLRQPIVTEDDMRYTSAAAEAGLMFIDEVTLLNYDTVNIKLYIYKDLIAYLLLLDTFCILLYIVEYLSAGSECTPRNTVTLATPV